MDQRTNNYIWWRGTSGVTRAMESHSTLRRTDRALCSNHLAHGTHLVLALRLWGDQLGRPPLLALCQQNWKVSRGKARGKCPSVRECEPEDKSPPQVCVCVLGVCPIPFPWKPPQNKRPPNEILLPFSTKGPNGSPGECVHHSRGWGSEGGQHAQFTVRTIMAPHCRWLLVFRDSLPPGSVPVQGGGGMQRVLLLTFSTQIKNSSPGANNCSAVILHFQNVLAFLCCGLDR